MSCNKCYKNLELGDKVKIICPDCFDKMSDLETKLAESETELKLAQKLHNNLFLAYEKLKDDNDQLKQQLAEKEKEIESLKLCRCVSCKNEYDFMLEGMVSDLEKELDKCNQDKISFAVEQLTEIRDYVKNCWSLDTTEGKVRLDIAKKIRLKIEELKGNENE